MSRFVFLLLGARLRLFYNSLRRGTGRARFGWIAAGLGLLAAATFSGFGGFGLTRLLVALQRPEIRQALLEANFPLPSLQPDLLLGSILAVLVLVVWGIVLLSSLGAALNNFYLSSDLDLLVAAPIPMRAIFTAKFLEGLGLSYLLLFALGGPALVGLGIGAHYSWPYFLGVVLMLAVIPLLPESIGTLLVMPLVRLIPPRRLREVLGVLGALVGTASYLFSQLSQEKMKPETAGRLIGWLFRLHLPFLPQAWAAEGLVALGKGRYLQALLPLGAFLLLSLGLYALCLVMAERLYYSGWAGLQTAPTAARAHRAHRARPAREFRFLPRQILGILAKDLRLFTRDPQNWSELLMPLAAYALLVVQMLRRPMSIGRAPQSISALSVGWLVLFVSMAMVSRLGLGGIGAEGKQFWLLRGAPLSPRRILWAKFLSAYLPFVGLGGILLLVLTLLARMDWTIFLGNWLYLGLCGLGITGVSVGLGASFPRMDAQRLRQAVSPGAGCLYFPIVGAYAGIVTLLLVLPPLLNDLLVHMGLSWLAILLWGIGFLGTVALTGLALWLPVRIGAARLAAKDLG